MSTVSSATSTAADIYSSINAQGNGSSSTGTTTAAQTQDRFLTLLTTQLKNQDPLNPMDNTQMTSQLAQINTVSGIEKLNSSLESLLGAYNNTQTMQAAAMIGKNVMVPGTQLTLQSGTAVGGIKLDSAADNVVIKISDKAGNVVATENLGARSAGSFTFAWDGKNASNQTMTDGNYKLSVEATKGSEKVTATAMQIGTVSAVVKNGSGYVLDLGSEGTFAFSDVQQIF